MTEETYTSLTPREAEASASSIHFAFYRLRGDTATRFYPGDGSMLHFGNRETDTFDCPGVPPGFFVAGDAVRVDYRGATVFRGELSRRIERRGRGDEATEDASFVGPWSKMQRMVYRQYWYTGNGYALSSRLILNQHRDGTAQGMNSELREIATHGATACGYTVGTVSVSTQTLPFDECRDITVADAIRRELRFFPKAICRFNYAPDTPQLIINRAATATDAPYVASVPKAERQYEYTEHPIVGVDLEIETTGTIDGVEYRNISHQTAGTTVGVDVLYATLQVKGASASTTRQTFRSKTEDFPSNLNDAGWWKSKHPRLANIPASAIEITDAARVLDATAYPRISSSTAGQLEEAGLNAAVDKITCKCKISTSDEVEEEIYLTMNFLVTNAKTKKYTWVSESSAESGETVPGGLAAAILADRAGMLKNERMTIRVGDTLPVLGDGCDGLFLQSFDIDCANLTADLHFGQPEHLSPEDMAALLSGFRNKRTVFSATSRHTGKRADDMNDEVEMGGIPPLSSTEFQPGQKAKTTLGSAGGSFSGRVVIDANTDKPTLTMTADGAGKVDVKTSELKSDETIGVHTLRKEFDDEAFEDEEVRFLSSGDFSLGIYKIIGGKGIVVTKDEGGNIVITNAKPCECPGQAVQTTSGYTGELTVVTDVSYDDSSHTLDMELTTLDIRKGLVKGVETATALTTITTAVEETV